MPWHKPRFRLVDLIALVVIVGVELAILPGICSVFLVPLTLATPALVAVMGPLTKAENVAIALIFLVVLALILPAAQHSHCTFKPPETGDDIRPAIR